MIPEKMKEILAIFAVSQYNKLIYYNDLTRGYDCVLKKLRGTGLQVLPG